MVLEEPNSRNWFMVRVEWIKPFNIPNYTIPVQITDTMKLRRFLRNVQWTLASMGSRSSGLGTPTPTTAGLWKRTSHQQFQASKSLATMDGVLITKDGAQAGMGR